MMLPFRNAVIREVPGNDILNGKIISAFYTSFPSPIGQIYIASIKGKICKVSIGLSAKKGLANFFSPYPHVKLRQSPKKLKSVTANIESYFKSGTKLSAENIAILDATPFQISVWEETANIPPGKTRTYKWIADKIGKPDSSRAVGNALGKNPVPLLIPCHRVIRSNGETGGFTGGKKTKEKLLSIERSIEAV